jgi:hypothetical protein
LLELLVLPTHVLDLAASGFAFAVTGQAGFPRFEEFFAPLVVQALRNAFASAQFSDAVLPAQSF